MKGEISMSRAVGLGCMSLTVAAWGLLLVGGFVQGCGGQDAELQNAGETHLTSREFFLRVAYSPADEAAEVVRVAGEEGLEHVSWVIRHDDSMRERALRVLAAMGEDACYALPAVMFALALPDTESFAALDAVEAMGPCAERAEPLLHHIHEAVRWSHPKLGKRVEAALRAVRSEN